MSNESGSGVAARNTGVARIRTMTRAAVIGAALLSAAFAGLAAVSTHARKTSHAVAKSARRTVTTAPVTAPSSAQVPAIVAPAQAPTQSAVPPVASSGGS